MLRHGCSSPQIAVGSGNKQMPTLDELLQHLLKKTQIEAESKLRTIGWLLNAIASVVTNKHEAFKIYQQVLTLEETHNGKLT